MQKKSENFVWRIKRNYGRTFKNQASTIKTIEKNLGRIAESIHGRGVGTLPSFTETNPRGLAHAITTHSGLNYQPPKNPLKDSDGLQNIATENITTEDIPTTEKITPEQTHNSTKKTDPLIPFPSRLKRRRRKNSVSNGRDRKWRDVRQLVVMWECSQCKDLVWFSPPNGFTLILATLDGLDVGLLGDVIGEDDCDDDG
ncbi:hypothetical protein Tco_0730804 [Tanacetum coccineum]